MKLGDIGYLPSNARRMDEDVEIAQEMKELSSKLVINT